MSWWVSPVCCLPREPHLGAHSAHWDCALHCPCVGSSSLILEGHGENEVISLRKYLSGIGEEPGSSVEKGLGPLAHPGGCVGGSWALPAPGQGVDVAFRAMGHGAALVGSVLLQGALTQSLRWLSSSGAVLQPGHAVNRPCRDN